MRLIATTLVAFGLVTSTASAQNIALDYTPDRGVPAWSQQVESGRNGKPPEALCRLSEVPSGRIGKTQVLYSNALDYDVFFKDNTFFSKKTINKRTSNEEWANEYGGRIIWDGHRFKNRTPITVYVVVWC